MASPQFERARSAEAKQIRERAILDAAAHLGLQRTVRAVTLTDIAAAVGMHKSTMLRYFETREEIFLRLTAEGYREWSPVASAQINALGQGRSVARHTSESGPAGVLSQTLVARPLFCDLIAQAPLNLERGVSFEAVRAFKLTAIAAVDAVALGLAELTTLAPEQARNVVTAALALAGAFWQMAAPGTDLQRFYQRDPELTHAIVDLEPRLTETLTALIRGFLSSGHSPDAKARPWFPLPAQPC